MRETRIMVQSLERTISGLIARSLVHPEEIPSMSVRLDRAMDLRKRLLLMALDEGWELDV